MCLVWFAGPAVIFAFWLVSTGSHNEWLTLGIALCFWLSIFAMLASMLHATNKLKPRPLKNWQSALFILSMVPFTWTLVTESWRMTEGGFEHYSDKLIPDLYRDVWRTINWPCDAILADECFDADGNQLPDGVLPETVTNALNRLPKTNPSDLMTIDLIDAQLVPLPADWRDWEVARMSWRETWCRRESLPMSICDHRATSDRTPPPHVEPARAKYCADNTIAPAAACAAHFTTLNARFDTDWTNERKSLRDALPALDLSQKDLRGAFALRASLTNADLSNARLEGADLRWTRLEGANLNGAQLQGALLWEALMEGTDLRDALMDGADLSQARMDQANLSGASMQGTYLSGARMEGALLIQARMQGAFLWGTRLEGANLNGARLDRADLSAAQMDRADLWGARMTGATLRDATLQGADLRATQLDGADLSNARMTDADIRQARMEGAILIGTDLKSADWAGAMPGAPAHAADLRGASNLTQSQLDQMIGNEATLLPATPAPDTGKPYTIPSCWERPPVFLDVMVTHIADHIWLRRPEAEIRADFLCGRHPPFRHSTRLPLNAPRPEGHPLGN